MKRQKREKGKRRRRRRMKDKGHELGEKKIRRSLKKEDNVKEMKIKGERGGRGEGGR